MILTKVDNSLGKYLLEKLNSLEIAYVHIGNFDDTKKFQELNNTTMSEFIRSNYKGNLIGCGSYTVPMAESFIASRKFDLIAFGRPFIANPDLIDKICQGLELLS